MTREQRSGAIWTVAFCGGTFATTMAALTWGAWIALAVAVVAAVGIARHERTTR